MNFKELKKNGQSILDHDAKILKERIEKFKREYLSIRSTIAEHFQEIHNETQSEIFRFIQQYFQGITENETSISNRVAWQWDINKWQSDLSISTYQKSTGHYVRIGEIPFTKQDPFKRFAPIPIFLPFINHNHLLFHASGSSLDSADQCIESIVYQILTSIHPSLVKVTAIDTVGLGKNFNRISPLNEQIKGPKIYHGKEVESILEKLITHSALVIQKYLSTNYESLDAYNQDAGIVAEPYHLVCISNFPENLSDQSIKNILSLASNGTKVGIHLLISLSKNIELPRNFDLQNLSRHCINIHQQDGFFDRSKNTFTYENQSNQVRQITLDLAPSNQLVNQITNVLNQNVTYSNVEISFLKTIPSQKWQNSSSELIKVDVGQIGAKDILYFTLGKNVHHALVAGKTGMGKTVFLHNLICKSALLYSPLELEFYLLDFKEGVEFKIYQDLPHMRVLAIDAEREYGLAILEGIEKELERRGNLFKTQGGENNSNIQTYRQNTNMIVSRIILIIDEFQVLFQNNDHIANLARKKLDYIARLGRSFGIHLILSTQSLMGVDIEQATLSQIGIRVAFSLSDMDAVKILGKDNDAAKYLSRPGEAIFNEDNQLIASNKKFQVFFEKSQEWQNICLSIKAFAESKNIFINQTIFRKDMKICYQDNHQFSQLIQNPLHKRSSVNTQLFVGKSFSLDANHLSILLKRKYAQNILMIGGEEIAMGICFGMILSILLSSPQYQAQIKMIDYENFDHDDFNFMPSLEMLHSSQEEQVIQNMYDLMMERKEKISDLKNQSPIFLILYGVHSSRNIQSIGGYSNVKSNFPNYFNSLISDGASLGIHLIVWSNQYAKIKNSLSNRLADFEYKIAFSNEAKPLVNLMNIASTDINMGLAYLLNQSESTEPMKFKAYQINLDSDLKINDFKYYSNIFHNNQQSYQNQEEKDVNI